MVIFPPYHFSTAHSSTSLGLSFPPTLCDSDKTRGQFTAQGAVYLGGALSLHGSLGTFHQIDSPGIYAITVSFLVTGRADIFGLGVPLISRSGIKIPLSTAIAEIALKGIVEDPNGKVVGSTTLSLVQLKSGTLPSSPVFPYSLHFSSSSHSLTIPHCLFQSIGLVSVAIDLQVRLRAMGVSFSRVDFASGGNFIAIPFIKVDPTP